MMDTRQDFCRC